MTTELQTTEGDRVENDVIAELAELAASREPIGITDHRVGLVLRDGQRLEQLDLEQYLPAPLRKRGTVQLGDPGSLVTYVTRHIDEQSTTLWANLDAGSVTAVFDDHGQYGPAGWGQHRAVLVLRATEDWKHWLKNDGRLMNQDEFAEHIEDGVDAIREPDAATMLEIAQHFHARSGAQVNSGRRLSGEIQFSYTEQTTATAGQRSNLEIPDQIVLGLPPFEGNDAYQVNARFRFRVAEGRLALGYRLIRPDRVRRAAFDDVVTQIATGTDQPVMTGTPRSS